MKYTDEQIEAVTSLYDLTQRVEFLERRMIHVIESLRGHEKSVHEGIREYLADLNSGQRDIRQDIDELRTWAYRRFEEMTPNEPADETLEDQERIDELTHAKVEADMQEHIDNVYIAMMTTVDMAWVSGAYLSEQEARAAAAEVSKDNLIFHTSLSHEGEELNDILPHCGTAIVLRIPAGAKPVEQFPGRENHIASYRYGYDMDSPEYQSRFTTRGLRKEESVHGDR